MNSHRVWAEKLWDNIDPFWELVDNSNVFTTIWQTMFAYSEYLYWLKESYGVLSMPLIASEKTIIGVIWDVDENIIGLMTTECEEFDYAGLISIPILRTTISYEDTEYVEGVDYTITAGDGKSITIDWGDMAAPEATTFYAPQVIMSNDDKIELYGNTGTWDLDLSEFGIEDKKHICYALRKYKHGTPDEEMFYRLANMLSGAAYAKYPGKVLINGDSLTVNYVNALYVVRYLERYYGSETREEISITVDGGIGASASSIMVGDIIVLDADNTVRCALVRGTDILFAKTVEDGVYDEAILFRPVRIDLMECHAINGDTVYSCYADTLLNDTQYDITHALNYDMDKGYIEQSVTYDMTDKSPCVANGDYVDMHEPLEELAYIRGWASQAEEGVRTDIPTGDDYISNLYMQGSGLLYYIDLDNYGEVLPELSVGDILVASVSYQMECGSITRVDSKTIRLLRPKTLYDMYGNAISGQALNFQVGEMIYLRDEGCGLMEEVGIKDGGFDTLTNEYVLTTTKDIDSLSGAQLVKLIIAKHRHIITEIDGAEITTDRTTIYGEYTNNCRVAFQRSKDNPGRGGRYTCVSADIGLGMFNIYTAEDMGEYGSSWPAAMQIAIYGPNINARYYYVDYIDGTTLTVHGDSDADLVAKLVDANIYILNNIYDRNMIFINSSSDSVICQNNIMSIAAQLLPAGTRVEYNG